MQNTKGEPDISIKLNWQVSSRKPEAQRATWYRVQNKEIVTAA